MVRFKTISIENYKSIGKAQVEFSPGLYKVTGENLDSSYTSNGAAKSSTMQAIMLCLYNKDYSGAPLESLNNRVTSKSYKLAVTLDWYNGTEVVEVQVVNIKHPGKMALYIDGVSKAQGARDVVTMVEKILGMGAQTFKLTHFITSATILELTQNLSQPQLFNDILHLAELQDLDKRLLVVQKDLSEEMGQLDKQVTVLSKVHKLQELRGLYNLSELTETLSASEALLDELEVRFSQSDLKSLETLRESEAGITRLQKDITDTKQSLRNGICSLCSTILLDKDNMELMNRQIVESQEALDQLQEVYQAAKAKYTDHQHRYQDARADLQQQITKIKSDMNMAHQIADIHGDTSNYKELQAQLEEIQGQLKIVSSARKLTKSGIIVRDIMDRFFDLVQLKVSEYSTLINLDHFSIRIVNEKLGMVIQVFQNGNSIPIESLSNGEKTRLSLLVLMAMLDAMKCISDSETNIIVLDEASSSFDASGVDELSRLFSHMKSLGQSIYLITHGSELDEVPYDYELKAIKHGGISSVSITHI
jgi:hypothetical protein